MGRTETRLATLLAPAGSSPLWTEIDLAALLLHQLQSPLAATGDPTFEEVLLSPNPDVARLRQIKECAKALRDDTDSGIPTEISHILYYAAIAAALLHTADRLTSLDSQSLNRGLNWAIELQWLPEPLKQLLQQALNRQNS